MIEHFINDYERHGAYTGFPSLGIEWQKMESPVLRQALGMQVLGETHRKKERQGRLNRLLWTQEGAVPEDGIIRCCARPWACSWAAVRGCGGGGDRRWGAVECGP